MSSARKNPTHGTWLGAIFDTVIKERFQLDPIRLFLQVSYPVASCLLHCQDLSGVSFAHACVQAVAANSSFKGFFLQPALSVAVFEKVTSYCSMIAPRSIDSLPHHASWLAKVAQGQALLPGETQILIDNHPLLMSAWHTCRGLSQSACLATCCVIGANSTWMDDSYDVALTVFAL